ncbi:MAG: YeiH family protein [Pseudomonadota bacterium]
MSDILKHTQIYLPGVLLSAFLAGTAYLIGQYFGWPSMLLALGLGLSLSFFTQKDTLAPGLNAASKQVLQIAIALLGFQVVIGDITNLGLPTALLITFGVFSTIGFGVLLARLLKLPGSFGALTGGATAICGASAAMALSGTLPDHRDKDQQTIITVIGVTALSSLAMILYPIVSVWLGLDDQQAGVFFGASIHNVPQAVGAGYTVSEDAGQIATLTKLIRISFLLPVILCFMLLFSSIGTQARTGKPVPLFLVLFFVFVLVNSFVDLPAALQSSIKDFSKFCLLIAIAAIGMKSNLKSIAQLGMRPLILMIGETLWLAVVVLAFVIFL